MFMMRHIRHSVGLKVLAGFWLTLILAMVCVGLVSRWQSANLEFERVTPNDLRLLHITKQRLLRQSDGVRPINEIIGFVSRGRGPNVVLYRVSDGEIVSLPDKFKHRIKRDVTELASQTNPIKVIRMPYQLLGPNAVTLNNQDYMIFLLQHAPPGASNFSPAIYAILFLSVLSVVFSVVFTRSLVTPIRNMRKVSQQLAGGNLQSRVEQKYCKQDELGELASGFNAMANKLSEQWESQQRLMADVSHELRSPLTRLNMAVALAEQAAKDNPVISEALNRIESETERMDKLIDKVLILSRTEASMEQKVRLSLIDLLEATINDGMFEAQQSGKRFNTETAPDIEVYVQKQAIQSAVENVVRNAIRYAESEISLTTKVIERETGSEINLIISDDGSGLDDKELNSVLAPFYRPQLARDRQSGGVGLGLAIAKAAMTAHDGTISAINREQGGLEVTLSFKSQTA